MRANYHKFGLIFPLSLLIIFFINPFLPISADPPLFDTYIVQASDTDVAAGAVQQAGGQVTMRLAIIQGVAATLAPHMYHRLQRDPRLRITRDLPVQTTGDDSHETTTAGQELYPSAITGAYLLHRIDVPTTPTTCDGTGITVKPVRESQSLRGAGVTIAVVDSGFIRLKNKRDWRSIDPTNGTLAAVGGDRCIVYRDFLPRTEANANIVTQDANSIDQYGHATHVIGTIADSRNALLSDTGIVASVGVAPDVNILIARALGRDGSGTYSQVIAAIDWIVANRETYNVRVLNLSLYANVQGPYWADPLNQAVMRAWQSGIVVVAAAGNSGPQASTITAPGNVPYVITVGAIKNGRYSANGYDELASFSSRGPTESAFVKPDVLSYATRTIAPLPAGSTLASQIPAARIKEWGDLDFRIAEPVSGYAYFRLSGTSMAAAQVSGIVALMLQAHPNLTNNQVKHRLMATARLAIDQDSDEPAYSIWEQGAGLVDAQAAVLGEFLGNANSGMNIAQDLNSDTHYWGYTTWDPETGLFQLIDPQTGSVLQSWNGQEPASAGGSRTWAGGSRTWAGGDSLWAGGSRTWAGGSRTWAGSDSLWAGGSRTWAGSTTPATPRSPFKTEVLIHDEQEVLELYQVFLPYIEQ